MTKRRSYLIKTSYHTCVMDHESGSMLGTFHYEAGYGVRAYRGDRGESKTFLTHGYRAAVGLEVVGYEGRGQDIARAKRLAREWVEGL
jgi:hypothetical protein